MGGTLASFCLSDSSARLPQEDMALPVLLSGRYQILHEDLPTVQNPVEEVVTPRSIGSNQSVLSAISPTKDRVLYGRSIFQSPLPLHRIRLAESSKPSAIFASHSIAIADLINHGDVGGLEEYVRSNQVDLLNVRLGKLCYTPLHLAVVTNQLAVAQYLLSENVDVDAKDLDGQSAVYLAYTLGHYFLAEALVAHKAALCSSPYSPYANSSATGGRSRSSSTSIHCQSSRSGAALPGRERTFSVSVDEDGVSEIVVPHLSSFRSIHSLNSIQQDSAKYSTRGKKVAITLPSPLTTESGSSSPVLSHQTIKAQKPLSKRLRKAAGKVMHLVLPKSVAERGGDRNRESFRPSLI